jgi:hypothetical protein
MGQMLGQRGIDAGGILTVDASIFFFHYYRTVPLPLPPPPRHASHNLLLQNWRLRVLVLQLLKGLGTVQYAAFHLRG